MEIQFEGENKSVFLTEFFDSTKNKVQIKELMDKYTKINAEFDEQNKKVTIIKLTSDEILLKKAISDLNLSSNHLGLLLRKPNLKYSNSSRDVDLLQDILIKLGASNSNEKITFRGLANGYYGLNTKAGIIALTQSVNLNGVTGNEVTENIWLNIISLLKSYNNAPLIGKSAIQNAINSKQSNELIKLAIRELGIVDDPQHNWFFNLLKNKPIISDSGQGNNEANIRLVNTIYAKLGFGVTEGDKNYSAKSIACTQAIIEYINIHKHTQISKTGINGIDKYIWPNAIQEIMIEYAKSNEAGRQAIKAELARLYHIEYAKIQPNCFTEDTFIDVKEGHRRICDIKKGDEVYSENPATGEKGLKRVTKVYDDKFTNTLRHIMVKDRDIRTTRKHPFYVIDQRMGRSKKT